MPLLYEKRGPVAILTLSRPEARNAWGQDYAEGLLQRCQEMAADDEVRCAILTGDEAGGAFSAGAYLKDPKTHAIDSPAAFIKSLPSWRDHPFETVGRFPKPMLAAVNGYAIGIGCLITFCCDLIVASERAEWRLPQAALGILPAYGGGARLARWVGRGLAMRLALGFPLGGEEAHRIGLAQWLVPHERLLQEALAVAEQIAALPPLAARLTKESLVRGLDIPNLSDAAHADIFRFMALELTEDKAEAHQAWRERRPAKTEGR